jgi:hypothetical protein
VHTTGRIVELKHLQEKKQRGKVHNTFHSNFNHKKFQLEVSFTYVCIDLNEAQMMALFSLTKKLLSRLVIV